MACPAGGGIVKTDGWPSVSVVVPTRDRPRLVERAIRGIVRQRYAGQLECVVVFDQSAPVSLGRDGSDRVRLIANNRRPGLAGARNSGVLAAQGELVAFCDDDDEWLPEKLERQVAVLRSRPEAVAIGSGVVIAYGGRTAPRLPRTDSVSLSELLRSRRAGPHPSTLLVRRGAFFSTSGLFDERIPGSYGDDYDWLLRTAAAAPVLTLNEPLVRVNWHRSSWFGDRWDLVVASLMYLLERHPEFECELRGLARIYGRLALAHAARGDRAQARVWSVRAFRASPRQPRAYLGFLAGLGIIPPGRLQHLAHLVGHGI
jgi:glycosyltransferase involved in cell wall biosynthesis